MKDNNTIYMFYLLYLTLINIFFQSNWYANSADIMLGHRQSNVNIREPLNYQDLYRNATDLCKMVGTNIV